MKNGIITHFIAGAITSIGGIWAIISFILYLVKDRPFDWISVWIFGVGMVVAIFNFVLMIKKTF